MSPPQNRWYTFLGPVLLATILFCMGAKLRAQSIQFQQIPNELGLSQNFISALYQDQRGFLWVGTKDGLNRFDGYRFKVYQHDPFDSTTISGNYIKAIFEDSQGRLWVGTDQGLNLFDQQLETFSRLVALPNAPKLQSSIMEDYPGLSHKDVSAIIEDQEGNIWLGSRESIVTKIQIPVSAKDFSQAKFTVFSSTSSENSLWGSAIKSLAEDTKGDIWVHSVDKICVIRKGSKNKSYQLDRLTWEDINPQWTRHRVEDFTYFDQGKKVVDKRILNVFAGKDREVWIKLAGGFARWQPATNDYVFHPLDFSLEKYTILPLANSNGKTIIDRAGRIWSAGTAALVIYDTTTHQVIARNHYLIPPDIDMPNDGYQSIYEDRVGNIWVGTSGSGLFKYTPQLKKFSDRDSTVKWTGKSIRSIYETTDGTVWLGTTSLQLLQWDRKTDLTTTVILDENRWKRTHQTELDYINCMQEDQQGNLWLGGERGLFKFKLKKGELADWTYSKIKNSNDPNSSSSVLDLHLDAKGQIWLLSEQAFGKFYPETGQFEGQDYLSISRGTKNEFNYPCIHQQPNGTFWLGTNEGLLKFLPEANTFTFFSSNPQDLNSLSHPQVKCIFSDPREPDKMLWIGTGGGGLNRYNLETGQFKHYKKQDGLPDNVVYGILEGQHQDLWLSTNQGLSHFNPTTGVFNNYQTIHGLQNNEFNTGAYFKNHKGELYFGGINGFNLFHPAAIKSNDYKPNIVITGLKLANKVVNFNDRETPFQRPLFDNQAITLSWKNKIFSFDFAMLDLTAPERNQYAYRMEGFNEEWQHLGHQHSANFTNLGPGQYTFHVKGTNHDGVWNESGVSVKVIILPPWWRSWWAYLFYFILLTGLVYAIYRFQLNRQLDRAEARRLAELDTLKNRLYTNITHEFRTPLTVIMGMTDRITGHSGEKELIQRNSEKLLRLINRVLDLAKLDSGRLTVHLNQSDIIPYLQYLTESFYSMASEKGIRLMFYPEIKRLVMDYDEEKIEHILYNLLSNAINFTDKGGKIILHAKKIEGGQPSLLIKISDTGVGIPAEHQEKIFDRFYQVEGTDEKHNPAHGGGGTGVGLALTKELVELMDGRIAVESRLGQGTTFSLFFPIYNQAVFKQFSYSSSIKLTDKAAQSNAQVSIPEAAQQASPIDVGQGSPYILLVEDNPDVANYIRQLLEPTYQIEWAADGQKGIDLALNNIPDLIISDVMMPLKNGFELCETLKTDERTSHIPIILLTAKATDKDKVAGLKTGADAYLMKPFNKDELFVRLEKLLELRQSLQTRFSQYAESQPTMTIIESSASFSELSIEEHFLNKLQQVVFQHLDDAEFDTSQLASSVQLSQSQLYRKLKALTDKTPLVFIREIRLKHAMHLLKDTDLNISEVAYAVGFNDPNYFSRVFHKEYGQSPSLLRK